MTDSARDKARRNRRVAKAVRTPRLALDGGWHEDPAFCKGFFDQCEDAALLIAPGTLDLALRAVELAERNGDPCLVHQGHGVLVHAYLARADRYWAHKTLESYRQGALDCCPRCRSAFFFREGDLLGEERKAGESLRALARSLDEGEGHLADDDYARRYFVRAISYHFAGDRDLALADAGRTLRLLSLDSPKGYFLDTIACMAVFIGGGGLRHDATALGHLDELRARLHGRDGWNGVHTRAFWARGHFHARQGDVRRADVCLETALERLSAKGLDREVLAASLDRAQLRCRPAEVLRSDNLTVARTTLGKCLRTRPGLREDHKEGLAEMEKILHHDPDVAFRELGAFRRSFIAPVPGQLGERIGPE